MEKQPKFQTIDEYIAWYPAEMQAILTRLRETIQRAAPQAQETIKYNMPTFTLKGNLIYFAAFKRHIGLFPRTGGINKALGKQMVGYEGTKDSIRFPLDQPIPYGLLTKIVKVRVKEDLAHHKKKEAAAKAAAKAAKAKAKTAGKTAPKIK